MSRSSSKHRRQTTSAPPGSVRIVAGKWRRRRLKFDDQPGLRPTPDRVRETLFSWLTPVIRGSRCLDLFAGSGALGFEAASRGAAHVTMVEQDRGRAALLEKYRRELSATEVHLIEGDAIKWLGVCKATFDIIFLDPPFATYDLGTICAAVERNGLIATSGLVYLETSVKAPPITLPYGWEWFRSQRAGQVRYDLAARNPSGTGA
ncbi:MAG TPA: 16S rRNA (guanine(966)-N(2))-methyltransferase RsmD [Gammaproteobacteria bacterium]